MKILVAIFAALLIGISAYQLSFTWFVNSHESAMASKAEKWVKDHYTAPEAKYPGDKDAQELYRDSLAQIQKARLQRLLDSTKDKTITWWGQSYQKAKENELLLGLDLQGGLNVTMNVELEGLIKGLSNNPNDPALKKALADANSRKATSDADFITLFVQSYKAQNPSTPLAPLFSNNTRNRLKVDASDNAVVNYIHDQADAAMQQTYNVLRDRIDKFGVSQPNINLDKTKGIITVELAGANDPDRIAKFLQNTAHLQFWEVYNINELAPSIQDADKALEAWLDGTKKSDSTEVKDSLAAAKANTVGDTTLNKLLDTNAQKNAGKKDVAAKSNKGKFMSIFGASIAQAQQMKSAKDRFSDYVGIIPISDTAEVNSYLNNP
ncbi:MAG: protein translocase subunit SecDF, partial [Bacteroidetes bacterium]|nr:protein translocase subunit SecDF [Bacteroidota bacterium]